MSGSEERAAGNIAAPGRGAGRLKRFRVWMAVAALVAVVGLVCTVLVARSVARSDAEQSRQAFREMSGSIASRLQVAFQREGDLLVSASTFLVENPNVGNAGFRRWLAIERVFERYPELDGITKSVIVTPSRLGAFMAQQRADPVEPGPVHQVYGVFPAGPRPFYCLSSLAASRTAVEKTAPGFIDLCVFDPSQAATRDTGRGHAFGIVAGPVKVFGFEEPLYRGGVVPGTVSARRAAFQGFLWTGIEPAALIAAALSGHPHTAVVLYRSTGSARDAALAFQAGRAPAGAASMVVDLHGGSSVRVSSVVASAGVFANGNAVETLIAGVVMTALLVLLVIGLGSGRERALRLVELRTRELARARDDAVEASNAKSVFVSTVSHELRTPLSGVIGTAELMLEHDLDPELREYAEIVHSSSEGLLLVINDILDYSKIEAGKLELDEASFALAGTIAEGCALVLPIANKKGVRLEVDNDPGLPGWLHGDAGRLRQVLINLLSNAVKFTADGRVTVHVSATTDSDASLVRVEVSDTGIGIDEPTLARLFQPFTQADSSTARKYGGTGLGLTISAQLVEMMGGTIGANSVPGEGSTFWFELPFKLATGGDVTITTPGRFAALGERDAEGNLTDNAPLVLVAEDNPVNQMLVTRQLDRCGYRAEVVSDGREAVEAIKRTDYAAVLMDCQMPELDGYEATREIRQLEVPPVRVPIIAMTAHSMSGDREKCLAAGMDDYVSKPIRTNALHDVLTQATTAAQLPAERTT